MEEHIREAGDRMAASALEMKIRKGAHLAYARSFGETITIKGFLKMYKERFTIRSGYVNVKDVGVPAPVCITSTPAPMQWTPRLTHSHEEKGYAS